MWNLIDVIVVAIGFLKHESSDEHDSCDPANVTDEDMQSTGLWRPADTHELVDQGVELARHNLRIEHNHHYIL